MPWEFFKTFGTNTLRASGDLWQDRAEHAARLFVRDKSHDKKMIVQAYFPYFPYTHAHLLGRSY